MPPRCQRAAISLQRQKSVETALKTIVPPSRPPPLPTRRNPLPARGNADQAVPVRHARKGWRDCAHSSLVPAPQQRAGSPKSSRPVTWRQHHCAAQPMPVALETAQAGAAFQAQDKADQCRRCAPDRPLWRSSGSGYTWRAVPVMSAPLADHRALSCNRETGSPAASTSLAPGEPHRAAACHGHNEH